MKSDELPVVKTGGSTSRLQALDGMRFVYCMWILLGHYGYEIVAFYPMSKEILARGSTAVDMFFLLSGFITYTVYHKHELRTWKDRTEFWSRQIARIAPGYLLSLVLNSYKLLGTWGSQFSLSYKFFGTFFTLIASQSWIPSFSLFCWNMFSWSVSCFILSWLVFPFAKEFVKKTTSLKQDVIWLGICYSVSVFPHLFYYIVYKETAAPIVMIYEGSFKKITTSYWYTFLHTFPLLRISSFVMGMFLAKLYMRNQLTKHIGMLGDMSVIMVIAITACVPKFLSKYNWYRDGHEVLFCTGLAPLHALSILAAASERGLFAKIFKSEVVSNLGSISFTVYIFQSLTYYLLGTFEKCFICFRTPILTMCIIIFANILFAMVINHYYEVPAQHFLRNKFKELTAKFLNKENKEFTV